MSLQNVIFGSTSHRFIINFVESVALIAKDKVSYSQNEDGTKVTGITLASGATFMPVKFVADSATFTQELVRNTGSRYYNQGLNFTVESDDLTTAHSIALEDKMVALVERGDGKFIVMGKTNGLTTTASTSNGSEEDGNLTFTLTGRNRGLASIVEMDEASIKALIYSA